MDSASHVQIVYRDPSVIKLRVLLAMTVLLVLVIMEDVQLVEMELIQFVINKHVLQIPIVCQELVSVNHVHNVILLLYLLQCCAINKHVLKTHNVHH